MTNTVVKRKKIRSVKSIEERGETESCWLLMYDIPTVLVSLSFSHTPQVKYISSCFSMNEENGTFGKL